MGRLPLPRRAPSTRQGKESLIVVNTHRVNEGLMRELPPEGSKADFFFIERKEPEENTVSIIEASSRPALRAGFGGEGIIVDRGVALLAPGPT